MTAAAKDSFRIERSTRMAAPPDAIFPHINDFRRWSAWSPYERLDPAMKKTYSGPPEGVGAAYGWESSGKAGVGRMEITDSVPNARVLIKLDFSKPFTAHNIADFTLAPDTGGTRVTWAMTGPSTFMSKVMGLFMNIDKMVGKDFEAGLANLKGLVEH